MPENDFHSCPDAPPFQQRETEYYPHGSVFDKNSEAREEQSGWREGARVVIATAKNPFWGGGLMENGRLAAAGTRGERQ